jgi:hypothetical protein
VVAAGALASTFRGPHIAFLPGRVTCPLAGVGSRAANASNRLVVDDPATRVTIAGATIDGATITIEDDRACAPKTPIADFVWLAEGPAPFTIHLEVFKSGHTWSIDLHTHEPTPLADRRTARYEPFTIVGIDNGRREVLVSLEKLAGAVGHVPLARRLSSKLMTTRDHLEAGRARSQSTEVTRGAHAHADRATRSGGGALFDRSIGIGALGRGSFLVRVRLAPIYQPRKTLDETASTHANLDASTSALANHDASTSAVANHDGQASGAPIHAASARALNASNSTGAPNYLAAFSSGAPNDLAALLSTGEWELSVEALTDRYLPEIVARDLRLYGIADLPLLSELAAGRLRKGQTLAFRTTGEVRLDDRTAPLEGARDLARTYIEFHMLGGIIAAALR